MKLVILTAGLFGDAARSRTVTGFLAPTLHSLYGWSFSRFSAAILDSFIQNDE